MKLLKLHILLKEKSTSLSNNLALETLLRNVLSKSKSTILPLFNIPELLSSASDKAKSFVENFSKYSNLDDSGISLPVFPCRADLKLHNISVKSKMVKKVMINFDLSKTSVPECITVLVLKNCEPENFNYILHRLILTNELLPHSWQMICFREFKVLTFKIVCIFRSKFKVVFWLNGLENFNCLKNFSNPFGAFTDQFSRISHYKTFPNSYFIFSC